MMRTPKRRTTIPVKYPTVSSPSMSRATTDLATLRLTDELQPSVR